MSLLLLPATIHSLLVFYPFALACKLSVCSQFVFRHCPRNHHCLFLCRLSHDHWCIARWISGKEEDGIWTTAIWCSIGETCDREQPLFHMRIGSVSEGGGWMRVDYRKKNTKHCKRCNQCVEQFDHHCVWLNNCIGKKNYRCDAVIGCIVLTDTSSLSSCSSLYSLSLSWCYYPLQCIFMLLSTMIPMVSPYHCPPPISIHSVSFYCGPFHCIRWLWIVLSTMCISAYLTIAISTTHLLYFHVKLCKWRMIDWDEHE